MFTARSFQRCAFTVLILIIGGFGQEADEILTATADSGVQDIILPLCRYFLDYNQTMLPNQFRHSTQVEIYR